MTDANYQAIQLVVFATGLGALFGPIANDAQPMRAKALIRSAAATLAALLIAFLLAAHQHFIWALLVAVFPSAWMTARVRDALDDRRRRWRRRALWVATLALCYAVLSVAGAGRVRIAQEQERQRQLVAQEKQRQDNLTRELAQLRQPWQADESRGVAELKLDRLTAWLAAPPKVEIDGVYEQELGETAQREVLLRVVFLNDSFLPVTPDVAPALTPVRWSVRIQAPGGGVLHEWIVEPADARALQPAERRDYQVIWDGRDARGVLVPPDEYRVAIELQTAAGREAKSLPLHIVDTGPIEIVEVDATTRYIQHQQEMSRWHDTIQLGIDSLERNRFPP